jgi:hypothetical protein
MRGTFSVQGLFLLCGFVAAGAYAGEVVKANLRACPTGTKIGDVGSCGKILSILERCMNCIAKSVVAGIAIGLGVMCQAARAGAESDGLSALSAQWWQWALSIPAPINPVSDTTGANCFIGQRGPIWFLAGSTTGLPTVRTCTVPEGAALFFPVINAIGINTPVCDGRSFSVAELRAGAAATIDSATGLSVLLDNRSIRGLQRVRSEIFATVFPQDNLFGAACLGQGQIYSPSVDDGYYVKLPGLRQGMHHLSIRGTAAGFSVDVFYTLSVVKVARKESD